MKIKNRWVGKIAGILLGAVLVVQCFAMTCLAAGTGTVTASDVNIRSDASTSSSVVGIASLGETYQVGDSREDESGNTWYEVTLTNGVTGYIRSDFIDVTEDDTASGSGTQEEQQSVYQIIQERGEDGSSTYYFVDNSNGIRLSFDEIEAQTAQVQQLQERLGTAGRSQRIWVIVLIILLVLMVIVDVSLYMRLIDAVRTSKPEPGRAAGRGETRALGRKEGRASASDRAARTQAARRDEEARSAREKEKEAPIMDFKIGTHPAEKKTDVKKPEEAKQKASNGPAISSFLSDPDKEAALEKEAAAARRRAVNWAADEEDADVKIAKPVKKPETAAGAGVPAPSSAAAARTGQSTGAAKTTVKPQAAPTAKPAAAPAVKPQAKPDAPTAPQADKGTAAQPAKAAGTVQAGAEQGKTPAADTTKTAGKEA